MTACADPLRVIYSRWCLLAAAAPVLAAAGAPLKFRISVDGGVYGVARYDASANAGATLARFSDDRAVLSCGDASWRAPEAPSASARLAGGPSWADHVSMLDHRLSAGHYGWVGFWDDGAWLPTSSPAAGAPLPPVLSTAATAAALGARWEHAFHLVRMSEYAWLDSASWQAAFGAVVAARVLDESWEHLRSLGLTQWTGSGPVRSGVLGRTPDEAKLLAAEHARERGMQIPDEVRVESALRTRTGWQVRLLDYRDAGIARPLVISVPDEGPLSTAVAAASSVRPLGTTPG